MEGPSAWNQWRGDNHDAATYKVSDNLSPETIKRSTLCNADLSGADLRNQRLCGFCLCAVDLSSADLSGADLTGTDLSEANLIGACLRGTTLVMANLHGAIICGANMTLANLSHADLSQADLREADLARADLGYADLSQANLSGVQLAEADLLSADLCQANLRDAVLFDTKLVDAKLVSADLTRADLYNANLQSACLDQAILNDAKMWETQRANWSIKDVICESIYWDRHAEEITQYAPGEFERLYSYQPCIELFYKNGISTFELSTLPALLQHLVSKHPETNIHLKTIEQTGGGAKITISLGNADEHTQAKAQTEATELLQYQLALRHNEGRLQQLQENFNGLLAYMTQSLIASAAPQNYFNAPIQNAFLASENAKQEIHQTLNDSAELIKLLDKLLTREIELTPPQSAEIETAKVELQKPNPNKSRLTRTLDFLKTLSKEALLKGAGKLGEKASAADWSNLLNQLGEFIHHLR